MKTLLLGWKWDVEPTAVCFPLAMQTPWEDMGKRGSLQLSSSLVQIFQKISHLRSLKISLIISKHFSYQLPHAWFYSGCWDVAVNKKEMADSGPMACPLLTLSSFCARGQSVSQHHHCQARRHVAWPSGQDHQEFWAEGILLCGHEVVSGLWGTPEVALCWNERPCILPGTGEVHELKAGSGYNLGGAECGEDRASEAWGHQSSRI